MSIARMRVLVTILGITCAAAAGAHSDRIDLRSSNIEGSGVIQFATLGRDNAQRDASQSAALTQPGTIVVASAVSRPPFETDDSAQRRDFLGKNTDPDGWLLVLIGAILIAAIASRRIGSMTD